MWCAFGIYVFFLLGSRCVLCGCCFGFMRDLFGFCLAYICFLFGVGLLFWFTFGFSLALMWLLLGFDLRFMLLRVLMLLVVACRLCVFYIFGFG